MTTGSTTSPSDAFDLTSGLGRKGLKIAWSSEAYRRAYGVSMMDRTNLRGTWYRGIALAVALSLVVPSPSFPQATPPAADAEAMVFNTEQLDAMLAPIALYPDALLTQTLMAATFPLQVVAASRWQEVPANKGLTGDALAQALAHQNWDPSVKSLIPFPQVLIMLNGNLDWTQQLGYAFATQEADVMNSVQRLRLQAQEAGYLKTTEQQRVVVEKSVIVIEPAAPQTVYVPVYSPTVVYGSWPYPAYPPVYLPPPPGYVVGTAFLSGLAFATGVAVVGSLWGWARPSWYGGHVNVNVNHYNNINVNRPPINSSVWRPPAGGVGGRPIRPPGGPVGAPARPVPLPANAVGRPNVQVPGNVVNKPVVGNSVRGGNTVNIGNVQRPTGSQPGGSQTPVGAGGGQRSSGPGQGGSGQRPAGGGQTGGGRAPRWRRGATSWRRDAGRQRTTSGWRPDPQWRAASGRGRRQRQSFAHSGAASCGCVRWDERGCARQPVRQSWRAESGRAATAAGAPTAAAPG